MNVVLWIIQILLALLFIFAGGVKLIGPVDEMIKQMPVPMSALFVRFIGVCELLGGLGLILPGLLRVKKWLTPIAAVGLVIIMLGATAIGLKYAPKTAILPIVTGLLLAVVAYGRWRSIPTS
ncbi:MAG TPA: DoxX family protein [Pyrinomonadaceae bacterium]|nr:DoxX family protein [Pyrinomonadaceae bacterium]